MSMSPDEPDGPLLDTAGVAGNSGMFLLDTVTEAPPRYPPSAVKKWLTCPAFWRLSQTWEPRAAQWTPHQSVGTAIHAGVAQFLRAHGNLAPSSQAVHDDPVREARRVLEEHYEPQETWALDGLQALTEKGVKRLIQLLRDAILPGATVVAVEYPDPVQDPRCGTERLHRVIDCLLARGDGLEVWDWKSKIRLDATYLGETARAVLHAWQLLDYASHTQFWARAGQFEPLIGRTGPVRHAAYGLVILGPKLMAQALPLTLTPARLAQWHQDALVIWGQMAQMDPRVPSVVRLAERPSVASSAPVWHNWEACTDRHLHFGKECQFLPACHELNGEEAQFGGLYRPI